MTAATDLKNALLTAIYRAEQDDARTPPSSHVAAMSTPALERANERARNLVYYLASAPHLDPELSAAFNAYLDRIAALLAQPPGDQPTGEDALLSDMGRAADAADPLRNMTYRD